ncbi:MAG: nucleotidyltransferase substrate binding protein [Candidatus Omnitrophota bacterium]
MALDLSSLEKAVDSFEKTLKVASEMSAFNKDQKNAVKAGVIQNFEFTYELCWKFMKRWLENNLGSTYVDGAARRELFRLGAEHQLIEDVDDWMEYHDARNQTAHTYNEAKAEDVFNTAKKFLGAAKKFKENLKIRND